MKSNKFKVFGYTCILVCLMIVIVLRFVTPENPFLNDYKLITYNKGKETAERPVTLSDVYKDSGTTERPAMLRDVYKDPGTTEKPVTLSDAYKDPGTKESPAVLSDVYNNTGTKESPAMLNDVYKDTGTTERPSMWSDIHKDSETTDSSDMLNDVYHQRLTRVKQVCLEEKFTIKRRTLTTKFNYSKRYRLAYKVVPKVGTSSFINVFSILSDRVSDSFLMGSRRYVHADLSEKVDKVFYNVPRLKNATVLFPSRNPYSRLYSAYIDKVYVYQSLPLVRNVINNKGEKEELSLYQVLKYNVTFQMFLDFVLNTSYSTRPIESHYNPIFDNTFCKLHNFIVIKQETFNVDLEYALKRVDVESAKLEAIHSALNKRRAELSVTGIVQTVMERLKVIESKVNPDENITRRFETFILILHRLWHSFQIQGYISIKSNFPFDKFFYNSEHFDLDEVVDIFWEEVTRYPVGYSESAQQRHQAMKATYDDINDNTVKKIQEVYKLDFKAFGYNNNRP